MVINMKKLYINILNKALCLRLVLKDTWGIFYMTSTGRRTKITPTTSQQQQVVVPIDILKTRCFMNHENIRFMAAVSFFYGYCI